MFRLLLTLPFLAVPAWADPLVLEPRLSPEGATVPSGVEWRVFRRGGVELDLVADAKGGEVRFDLPAGEYHIHAAFGRSQAVRTVMLDGPVRETIVLDAGGLRLGATSGGKPIPLGDVRNHIYSLDEDGERRAIALNVRPNDVVRLNEGRYHVVSRFGTVNARTQADLFVRAGQITSVALKHRGARVSFALTSEIGGPPVANTQWTIFTDQGEKIFQSSTVTPSVILAEGRYEALVRNGSRTYNQIFDIRDGDAKEIEILLPN